MIQREDPNYMGKAIVEWLKYAETHDFKIGDYLVKYERKIGNKWVIEKFNHRSDDDVWRKYKVTYKDELGIPYVQKVTQFGDLSKEQYPLVNVDLSSYRYEIDPDYETYILLGKEDEYDPQGRWKQRFHERSKKALRPLQELLERVRKVSDED